MKYLITLTLLIASVCASAQKTDIQFDKALIPFNEGKITYSKSIAFPELTKQAIFSKTSEWIVLNFKDANAVTKLSDKETGKIILKGNTRNSFVYGKTRVPYRLDFTVQIISEENRIRIYIQDFIVNVDGGATWNIETMYNRIPDQYEFDKLGSIKRNEMLRAKQILINTDSFAKISTESLLTAVDSK